MVKVKKLNDENMVKKLAISFFFMSIIPILLIMYILSGVGFDNLAEKFPYIRYTLMLVVCLATVMFLFLRYNIRSISKIIALAKEISGGNYKKRVDVAGDDEGEIGQLAKSFNKITSELEDKIKKLEESKRIIQDIFKKTGAALSSSEGIDELLRMVTEIIAKGTNAASACIMLVEPKEEDLKIKVSYGIDDGKAKKITIKLGSGIIGISAKEKRAIISARMDLSDTAAFDEASFNYQTIISVPLLYKDECMGVLAVFDKRGGLNFQEDDKVLISNISSQIAVAIANARLNEDAEKTYIETITALAMAVEAKDKYSRGHLDRVARLVVDFAQHLGLSEKTTEILKDGAELHDLGKIGVRDDILSKKEPLTEDEQQELRKHVIIGENIMRPVRKLIPLCGMVRHHQEWWDGTGYPDGLKGEKIPLTARILKIVDAYDAMATDRSYRKALGKELIKEQFKKGSGKEFDPGLVGKFLEII